MSGSSGSFKGHSFIIVSVKESKFLDYCPLTLSVKSLQSSVVLGTTHPTMQCHFPVGMNLGKVNFFHEFLFFPLDTLSYIFQVIRSRVKTTATELKLNCST